MKLTIKLELDNAAFEAGPDRLVIVIGQKHEMTVRKFESVLIHNFAFLSSGF